jgi:23S rRNA pseudouridine2605 synthase
MSEKTLPGDRIAKVLARAGVASRREAERMIEAGRVTVNGRKITSPALNIQSSDRITVDGRPLAAADRPRLFRYHKPTGLVTSARDEKGRRTVFDALPDGLPRLMSVGRLDLNSEGLLLLTNDGELKRKLELPSTGWVRKYRVRAKGRPVDAELQRLSRGITVDGERFQPMSVAKDSEQGANAWFTVGLREGKNREVRRAFAAIGLEVNRLIRTSYGPFQLGQLGRGEVEEVKAKVLRDQLGLEIATEDAAPLTRPAADPGQSMRQKPARPAGRSPRPAPRGSGRGSKR